MVAVHDLPATSDHNGLDASVLLVEDDEAYDSDFEGAWDPSRGCEFLCVPLALLLLCLLPTADLLIQHILNSGLEHRPDQICVIACFWFGKIRLQSVLGDLELTRGFFSLSPNNLSSITVRLTLLSSVFKLLPHWTPSTCRVMLTLLRWRYGASTLFLTSTLPSFGPRLFARVLFALS